ncbi:hypothetical protein qu_447 [Acanthamoeba polyphaga mimivirus]|nr:hypothetical protein [Mimivirus reunion]WMV61782.1 hypothetical protein qu_447 [Mimivirus sp.]WMV62759.1 hypothetical protein qu_447 [Acanthamoeba polyphaga mimivirus]WMV63736.1 hypothetical protein qu_447 [Mimivirus sp.]
MFLSKLSIMNDSNSHCDCILSQKPIIFNDFNESITNTECSGTNPVLDVKSIRKDRNLYRKIAHMNYWLQMIDIKLPNNLDIIETIEFLDNALELKGINQDDLIYKIGDIIAGLKISKKIE